MVSLERLRVGKEYGVSEKERKPDTWYRKSWIRGSIQSIQAHWESREVPAAL